MTSSIAGTPNAAHCRLNADAHTAPFWAGTREHRLSAPRCRHDGTFTLPPTGFCPTCRRQDLEWVDLLGQAELYTFTVVRAPVVPELAETLPYVIAVVKLDGADDLKMITNIVECDVDDLRIGQRLQVVFVEQNDELTLPVFRPL